MTAAVPPVWLSQLRSGVEAFNEVDLIGIMALLRATLTAFLALPVTALGVFERNGDGSYRASSAHVTVAVAGLAAMCRICSDDQKDICVASLDGVNPELAFQEPALLWTRASAFLALVIGQTFEGCDYVGPRNGKLCCLKPAGREWRCGKHLSAPGLSGDDFLVRLGELLAAYGCGSPPPVLRGLGPGRRGDLDGDGAGAVVCGLCCRAMAASDILSNGHTVSVADAVVGFMAMGSGFHAADLLDSACRQWCPAFCLTCALHRPSGCALYGTLFWLASEFPHGDQSWISVEEDAVTLTTICVMVFDPGNLVPGSFCALLGSRLGGEVPVHGLGAEFVQEHFPRASLLGGLSPAQMGAARQGPRRREEHMDALAAAAAGAGGDGLNTPFGAGGFGGPPPSVGRVAPGPALPICALAGCSRTVWVDRDGGGLIVRMHEHCSRAHAEEAARAAFGAPAASMGGLGGGASVAAALPGPLTRVCALAGCAQAALVGFNYCGPAHAREAGALTSRPPLPGARAVAAGPVPALSAALGALPGAPSVMAADISQLLALVQHLAGSVAALQAAATPGPSSSTVSALALLGGGPGGGGVGGVGGPGIGHLVLFLPFGEAAPGYEPSHHEACPDGFGPIDLAHPAHILRYMGEDFLSLAAATLPGKTAKFYGQRCLRLTGVDRLDLDVTHSSLLFTTSAVVPYEQHEVAAGGGLSLTASRRKVGQLLLPRWRDYGAARMRDLLDVVHTRTGLYHPSAPGSAYRIAVVRTMCATYQLLDGVVRYLMEQAPLSFTWVEASRFIGIIVSTHLWKQEITRQSLWSQICEVAIHMSLRDLEILSPAPRELRALVLQVANGNSLLLTQIRQAPGPSQTSAPTGAGPVPAPKPPAPAGGAFLLCNAPGCTGYSANTRPPFACTHVFTVICDRGCGLCHARVGPRKWTCAQARALSGGGVAGARLSAAFKVSAAAWMVPGFAGADAALQLVVGAAP